MSEKTTIEKKLRNLGLSRAAVQAAWPTWWSEEAEMSPSAINDLKFSLARKLGIAPTSLFDEGDAVFIWHGEAKFKGLGTESEAELKVLSSFGASIARLLILSHCQINAHPLEGVGASQLRDAILDGRAEFVGISHLLGLAKSFAIPVVYLRVFPLEAKRMTAMTVRVGDRFAILLGRDAMYSPLVSFYIAHELGHIAKGHLHGEAVLIDLDISSSQSEDNEESEADAFGLELLTGRTNVSFALNRPARNAAELASAVQRAGKEQHIDPGILALCYGHTNERWQLAMAALKILYGPGTPAWQEINNIAMASLDFEKLTTDHRHYLSSVLGVRHDA